MPQKIELDEGMAETLRVALDLDQFYPVLSAEKAMRLFPQSALYVYNKGEDVVVQDEDSQDIYIIQTGRVSVTQTLGSAAAQLAELGPGDMFGEMAILRAGKRTATVNAAETSRIYRLCLADLKRIMSMDDKLSRHLTELAEKRLAS
ncbi:MAG: cyclic nucleotide-binding domain-containing protein [Elusimicrobiota bacterium]